MSKEDMIGVLWALENDLRLDAARQSHTFFTFIDAGMENEAMKALGVYEGLMVAINALQEKRRGLGGDSDDRGHRESAPERETDPTAPARD